VNTNAVFSVEYRDRVGYRVLELAGADTRVVAGAIVGSLARDSGDRWSDLDLTFAVADDVPIAEVLEDWTARLVDEFTATKLFDLPSGPSIYRVFLLPGCLQFDLSFTPSSQFGATGPAFKLIFGSAVDRAHIQPPVAHELFGYAVHHLLRARFCIERGRYWHAEYWISAARDYCLSLACVRLGLPAHYGRGFDDLPPAVTERFRHAFVGSLDRDELRRALGHVIRGLVAEAGQAGSAATEVTSQLDLLTVDWRD